ILLSEMIVPPNADNAPTSPACKFTSPVNDFPLIFRLLGTAFSACFFVSAKPRFSAIHHHSKIPTKHSPIR
ncbi:hypothetical protein, partial [Xenorhabdus bovienii]|uniref:hypothetical protein n=1 Tax=Xenorhabdus bovienii TaxID=40576 RepID=UPI00237C987F